MTQAYLYKWTEKSTGMWYIGSRSRKGCHPADGYICSSKVVEPLIKENKDNWIREILVIGEPFHIRELESNYLKQLNAKKDPMSYNKHNGDGKFTGGGRVRGSTSKLKAKTIIDFIEQRIGMSFEQSIIEGYKQVMIEKNDELIKRYQTMFTKYGIEYEPR